MVMLGSVELYHDLLTAQQLLVPKQSEYVCSRCTHQLSSHTKHVRTHLCVTHFALFLFQSL